MSDAHAGRVMAPDRVAAALMWTEYGAAHPEVVAACEDYTVEHFGDSPELADELLELVLTGRKRATAELVSAFTARGDVLPRIGSHWIACDSTGRPRLVLRSTSLRIGPFDSVDEGFAAAEAEGDLSLESWLEGHRRYWARTCASRGETWSPRAEIVFEYFTVVWPPVHADHEGRGKQSGSPRSHEGDR